MGRKRCGVVWIYYLMPSERLFVVAAVIIRWIYVMFVAIGGIGERSGLLS